MYLLPLKVNHRSQIFRVLFNLTSTQCTQDRSTALETLMRQRQSHHPTPVVLSHHWFLVSDHFLASHVIYYNVWILHANDAGAKDACMSALLLPEVPH